MINITLDPDPNWSKILDPDSNSLYLLLVTCSEILQGHLWTTGKNIWISVVLAVILAGAGALLDLGSKGNFISFVLSLSPVCISTFKLFMFFNSFCLRWYKVPEPGGHAL